MRHFAGLSFPTLAALLLISRLSSTGVSAGGAPDRNRATSPSHSNMSVSHPSLSFTCKEPVGLNWTCHLVGAGFQHYEQVRITFTLGVGGRGKQPLVWRVYRRTTTTDGQGSFTRPPLVFAVDPRNGAFAIHVVARGTRGDSATAGVAGAP